MISSNSIRNGFELPIRFNYREPRWLPVYYITLHIGAFICSIANGMPLWIRGLLILYILSSLFLWFKARRFRIYESCSLEINLNVRNEWTVRKKNGPEITANLLFAKAFNEKLIFIRLKSVNGKRYDIWLNRSCADETTLRRLRVRLLFPISTSSMRN